MRRKLSKHGNSLALVIENPILELLGITADTELEIVTDGVRLIIFRADDDEARFRVAAESVFKTYDAALRRLADS